MGALSPCRLVTLSCALLALAAPVVATAATPRESVLRLVPDDVGFCLVVQNLREHSDTLMRSPFATQFLTSPLGLTLAASAPAKKLSDLHEQLKLQLRTSWPQLRDEILGDIVVFAYRPPPTGKPEDEQDLAVLHARDANALAGLLERLNALQKQSGDLKELATRTYRGVEYVYRAERNKDQFYYRDGPLLAFSSKEAMLRRVIDRARDATDREAALPKHLDRLGAMGAPAVLWVNPRAFDAQLEQKSSATAGAEALVVQKVLTYWKALDGMALTLQLHRSDVEVGVTFLAKEGDLPSAARKFFAGDNQLSELWQRFPANALFALAGRVDTVALTELVGDFVPEEARRDLRQAANQGAGAALGVDVSKEILPNLGPDWGVCVVASGQDDKKLVPPVLAALRVRPGNGPAPVDRLLFNGLHSLAMLIVLGHNASGKDQLALRTVFQDGVEVKFLTGERILSAGLQPALALKDGYLVLATSPEAIRQFVVTGKPATSAANEAPWLRMSVSEVRRFALGRLDALAAHLAEMRQITAGEAREQLKSSLEFTQLFDRFELIRRADAGRMSLVARLSTEQPLRRQ